MRKVYFPLTICAILGRFASSFTQTPSFTQRSVNPDARPTHLIASTMIESDPHSDDEAVVDGEVENNNETTVIHLNNDKQAVISKQKWKKKRFLMIKDVNAAIQKENPRAAQKAEEIIQRMWKLYELSRDEDFKPDLQVYNLWIHAIAKSKSRNIGEKAEAVVREMKEYEIFPNVVSYTSVMDAYANEARFDRKAPEHAERVLFYLIEQSEYDPSMKVTSVTADVAMNAWAQQGSWESALRAQQILDKMENTRIMSLRPTVHSYATVIHGWAVSKGGTQAAQRAERVLNGLLKGHKESVKPDTVVFNAVIDAWSSSGDTRAGSHALSLLNKMKQLRQTEGYDCEPDTVTYNTVLSAWSHSGHINSAQKAEQILQSMVEEYRENPNKHPAPNTVSYNSVLHAWSRSSLESAVGRAETILNYMIRSGNRAIAPDLYSFTTVLNALAKSKQPKKAEKAREYLDVMLQMHASAKQSSLRPTQVPFNAVFNAAAFSALGTPEEEQRMALKTAVETFSLMKRLSVNPDMISYGNMLKVVANLVPKGKTRTEMALQLFQACCNDGLVGELVWSEARRALPAKTLTELLPTRKPISAIKIQDLPNSWKKSLPKDRRMHMKPIKQKTVENKTNTAEEKRKEPVRRFRNIAEQSYQSGRDI